MSLSLVALFIVISANVYIDIYGLFRKVKDRKIQVYHNEKETKYLLSYAYIPENFNAILIGPSLSDNIDALQLSNDSTKVYNASVMGANISELKRIVENAVLSNRINQVIICLHPYLTKGAEIRASELNDKSYFGAIGSLNLYQTYALAVIRELNLMPSKFPNHQINWYGTNEYYDFFRVGNVKEKIHQEAQVHANEQIIVDPRAIDELKELLSMLSDRKIDVLGYFHPIPKPIYEANKSAHQAYQRDITAYFDMGGRIIDFNNKEYHSFCADNSNFIDHGHLSRKGQSVIADILSQRL